MRLIILFILLAIVCVSGFFFSDADKRWLFFNGNAAEIYATQLLNGDVRKTPDEFIDYSVSSSNGYVLFSKHDNHETIYGYFPEQSPIDGDDDALKVNWEQLNGNWFVAHH